MSDWIEAFVEATSHVNSPLSFRLWAGIGAVSGALERRAWTDTHKGPPIYPGLFVVLVGTPATGKGMAIGPVKRLWANISNLHIAPDDVNKATLVINLAKAVRVEIEENNMKTFCAMSAAVTEFGVFFPTYDPAFLAVLTKLYDDEDVYIESRVVRGDTRIEKPHLVILAATQPDTLGSFMPEEAWGQGFTSRLLLIFGEPLPPDDIIGKPNGLDRIALLEPGLKSIFKLQGEFEWTEAATSELNSWSKGGKQPVPTHYRLMHYLGRRAVNLVKLSMIAAVSRSKTLRVTVDDVRRARSWLTDAEEKMPDIFRAMNRKSDAQLVRDLHYHIWQHYTRMPEGKRKAVPDAVLYDFLSDKVTSGQVRFVIQLAEKSGLMRQSYPGEWTPRPLNELNATVL